MPIRLVHSNKFEANQWLITARWFYAPAIFIMGLLSKLDPFGENVFPLTVMIFLFSTFILTNVFFWQAVKKLSLANNVRMVSAVGIGQIIGELMFFTVLIHLSGGIESVTPIFFFIPIVSSIILFNPLGSLFVAFIAGIIVNAFALLEYYGLIQKIFGWSGSKEIMEYDQFLTRLSTAIVVTAVYFIVAALVGYLSSALRRREWQLREDKRQAQLQAEKLRLLNEEYNTFTRKLIRKDLELKKDSDEANKLNQEKSDFVSTVAHQLRTPLSATKWTLDILLREDAGKLTSDQRALLMKAYESNERIIGLIQDMLGADKAEIKGLELSLVEINITDLINNIVPDFRSQVEKKGLKITILSKRDLPKIRVDLQKIRAVLQNLIENAVKYSKRGGEIKVTLSKVENNLQISVEDSGIGIPKEEQQNIFKKFFRAQNAVREEPNGSGLGLFIVRSIIERHGGSITFESEENKGTKFILNLPIAQH